MSRNEEFSNGRNQDAVDKKFNEIMLGQVAHEALGATSREVGRVQPFPTAISAQCNHCDESIEVNALYHPLHNAVAYKCPSCKRIGEEEEWFEREPIRPGKEYEGTLRGYNGEKLTAANIKSYMGGPDPSLPPAPTDAQMRDQKWLAKQHDPDCETCPLHGDGD